MFEAWGRLLEDGLNVRTGLERARGLPVALAITLRLGPSANRDVALRDKPPGEFSLSAPPRRRVTHQDQHIGGGVANTIIFTLPRPLLRPLHR
jgi:hypothetical protein